MGNKAKEFGDKLKDLLESRDMTQRDLAKRLFLTDTAVYNYVSGKRLPRFDTVKEIAKYFNVTTDFLLGLVEVKRPKELEGAKPVIENNRIPILGSVRAGLPSLITDDNIIGYEYVDDDMMKHGEIFALTVHGDSMEPLMSEGDIIIIKRTPDVDNGDIAVVLVNGDEATVKKIKKSSAGITLIPFNQKYDPIFLSNDDVLNKPVLISGVVLEIRKKLKYAR